MVKIKRDSESEFSVSVLTKRRLMGYLIIALKRFDKEKILELFNLIEGGVTEDGC